MSATHDADTTRRRIQEVAIELFAAHGYTRTSLREIAEHLSISKPALYYHFASKEALLMSVVEPMLDELHALIEQRLTAKPTNAAVRRFLSDYADLLLRNRRLVALMQADIAVLSETDIGRRAHALFERLVDAVAGSDASLDEQVRMHASIGALGSALLAFPDVPDEVLRGPALAAALAPLRLRRPRSRESDEGQQQYAADEDDRDGEG